jgi:hypothetical protein
MGRAKDYPADVSLADTDGVVIDSAADGVRFATLATLKTYAQGTIPASITSIESNIDTVESTATALAVRVTALEDGSVNAQTGTTYTLVLGDRLKIVTLANAAAITLTVPDNSSVAFPVGTRIDLIQIGAGQVTVAAPGTATVSVTAADTLKLRAEQSAATLIQYATDLWTLVGDLEQA